MGVPGSRILLLFALGLAALTATGCGSATPAAVDRSAVRGRVFGYGCPAQRPGQPCGSPFRGILTFRRAVGGVIAKVHTDGGGRFHLALAAGRYVVIANGLENTLAGQTFQVEAGHAAHLDLTIRNGIE